jgi:hypothetical protein
MKREHRLFGKKMKPWSHAKKALGAKRALTLHLELRRGTPREFCSNNDFLIREAQGPGAAVKLLPCDHDEAMGSSP